MNSQQPMRKSQIKHQEEFKKEILAPIYWFIAICVGGTLAVVLYSYFGSSNLSNAADIGMIWMTLLLIVIGLIVLAALVFAINGMAELDTWVDRYAGIAQTNFEKFNASIRKLNKKLTDPLRRMVEFAERFRGE